MTEKEATAILHEHSMHMAENGEELYCEAVAIAERALNKQTAKKPIADDIQNVRYTMNYICPCCGGRFTGTGFADYCYRCGQKLLWESEGDNNA